MSGINKHGAEGKEANQLSSKNFIEEIIENDIASQKNTTIQTRFPPEPNGLLHIGHAKSIALNFGIAKTYNGKVNLRFDDTNPSTEKEEYSQHIKKDIEWLGFKWDKECYTSDYFEQLYELARLLIEKGLAYVDDSSTEKIAEERGVPTLPGKKSAYRNRSIEQNKMLFEKMKEGVFANEEKVLRAKIDMSSPNMHLRDPVIYRIKHECHQRTGDKWCVYPMYDFAHGQSDAIEKVTHSICTLEFAPHRALYDWFIQALNLFPSKQYEFARLNLSHTVMSKRQIAKLVEKKIVSGWDDPRLPTISGMRRRGYTPESILNFCKKIGVQKRDALIEIGLLESCVRNHLNKIATRRMVVFNPLKLVITNWKENIVYMQGENNPEDDQGGSREIPFSKELYIEKDDFLDGEPPKKYFRLALGKCVRLKHAYIIKCDHIVYHQDGEIKEIHCSYIPNSKSGEDTSGVSVKGTLHWVCTTHAIQITISLYDRLFICEEPAKEEKITEHTNPNSLQTIKTALAEPSLLKESNRSNHFQFLRKGYFHLEQGTKDTFHHVVSLRDSWKKNVTQ